MCEEVWFSYSSVSAVSHWSPSVLNNFPSTIEELRKIHQFPLGPRSVQFVLEGFCGISFVCVARTHSSHFPRLVKSKETVQL
jgi:hypothetical protein